ncbi:hypothetical protein QAD02_008323 [Eretmocerus hayati]|uniref:Uncharacterized protein n=1 Tax=Eretmocerus hayati TaxID=131215 RepID=A0ACC2N6Z8_9HYME|nr:hypothetical protein QAD02_008323 [Eretmocerus hayati]
MTIQEAAKLAIKEVEIFWEKSGIPHQDTHNSICRLKKLHSDHRVLKKNNARLHSDGEAANFQTSSQSGHPSNASQVIPCSSQVPNSQHSTQSIADDKATDEVTSK